MDKSIIKKQLDIQQASRKMDPHLSSEELENLKKLLDSKTCCPLDDDYTLFQEKEWH